MSCKKIVAVKLGSTFVMLLSSCLIHKDMPDAGVKITKDTAKFVKKIKLVESIVECFICGKQECICNSNKE